MTPVDLALQRLETQYALDGRCSCFAVNASSTGTTVELDGIVENDYLRTRIVEELEHLPGVDDVTNDLTTLGEHASLATITSSVAPVRDEPARSGEQTTQVLYGAAITTFDRQDDWQRVRTPDGYLGWLDGSHIAPYTEASVWEPTARITAPRIDRESTTGFDTELPAHLYAGTDCRIESPDESAVTVSFRTGASGTLPAESITRLESTPSEVDGRTLTEFAKQYLGTTYEWGGLTVDGIDCSGLIWLSYYCAGLTLPRDSDQLEQLGVAVERTHLDPGDLLCFPGHIALSMGGQSYIHAYGQADGVAINSLDPAADNYLKSLDESLRSTRRLAGTGGTSG